MALESLQRGARAELKRLNQRRGVPAACPRWWVHVASDLPARL